MKDKVFHILLVIFSASLSVFAQVNPIAIEWQRSFGGLGLESGCQVRPLAAAGYIVAGNSASASGGNKTSASYGFGDLWSIRLDPTGEIVWQRSDGASGWEFSFDMVVLPNGDILHAGDSLSGTGGNRTNANNGTLNDSWVVRIDANGNKVWDRTVGSPLLETAPTITGPTSDGGFILGAEQIPPSPRDRDFAVWRLDANGSQIWNRGYGGPGHDKLRSVQQTSDGGYVLAGDSNSAVGRNKTVASAGGYDFWVVRTDAQGTVLWDGTFGGTGEEQLKKVRQTADGGFILAGNSASGLSGNKTSPSFGSNDFWFVRVDTNGVKLWDRTYGTTGDEVLLGLDLLSDGGVIAGGYSTSETNGSRTAPSFGSWDGWLIRLDADGNRVWDQSLGGSNMDAVNSVQQTPDGGFIIGADSLSLPDGNKTTAVFGEADFWVIKLGPEKPRLHWETDGGTQWRLVLRGLANQTYRVEASLNLVDWVTVRTTQVNAAGISILESLIDASPQRYFRARD
jgi:hypothetical protein